MVLRGDMWLLTALTFCGLMLGRDGGSLATPLHRPEPARRTHLAGLSSLRALRDVLPEEAGLCVSENEERLLCTDRRSHFNLNPFGLRFGKRHGSYTYSRALRRATTNYLPLPVFGPKLLPT